MGRPREFDEQKVLEAAVDVFWAKGFEATSTRDLTECTGLTQSSIYAAYHDKRGIFLRALQHYLKILHERIERLEATKTPGGAIGGFFREVVDRSLADPLHRGCMLVNTALEATADDPELQRFVADETAAIEAFFRRCLVAGERAGEISLSSSPEAHARHLLAVLLGLRVLARVCPSPKVLKTVPGPALASIGLPWRAVSKK
jgi:TetR/AcrR family transcriptional repressor of nem operon